MSACGTLFRRLSDGAMAQCGLEQGHVNREGQPTAHAEFRNGERPEGLGPEPLKPRCHPTLCAQEPDHVGSHDTVLLPGGWRTPRAKGAEAKSEESYRDLADRLAGEGYGPDDFGGSDFP